MSVFGDFQKAWAQRFPGCELPQAWEEDVRANLTKHRQKLAALNAELEKEEFYVEYLENLLAHVERVKHTPHLSDAGCENGSLLDSSAEKENKNANSETISISDDSCLTPENFQHGSVEKSTSTESKEKFNDQNSYVTVIEVGGPGNPADSFNSKCSEKEAHVGSGKSFRSDDDTEVEMVTFQKKKPPAPPKKPRKSIPVQAVPPVKQNTSIDVEESQKLEEKLVIEAVAENTDDANNSLVTSEKQEVVLDMVSATDKADDNNLNSEEKNNKENGMEIHSQDFNDYTEENIYDTVAPDETETSSSHTVVSESSKEDGEGDYVVFNESYDSYPECPPPVVSSRSRIAECLLNTQRSVEEESPEYATYMNIDYFLRNQKGALSKITRSESVGADSDEDDAYLARSFSDHENEPEQVADYSEKKGNGTSAPNDDVFDMDSGKFNLSYLTFFIPLIFHLFNYILLKIPY